MRTQIYVFLLLVFDLWIAINLEFRLPRISKYGMLYTKKKKDMNWRMGALDLIVLMEFVCVAAGEGAMI